MGSRYPSQGTTTIVTAVLGTAGLENIIATTAALTLPFDGSPVFLHWYVKYTTGTTGPLMTYNVRRGPLGTSPLVNASIANCTEVGSINLARGGCMLDANPGSSQPQYSLCMNFSNAANNCTILEVALLAFSL